MTESALFLRASSSSWRGEEELWGLSGGGGRRLRVERSLRCTVVCQAVDVSLLLSAVAVPVSRDGAS